MYSQLQEYLTGLTLWGHLAYYYKKNCFINNCSFNIKKEKKKSKKIGPTVTISVYKIKVRVVEVHY